MTDQNDIQPTPGESGKERRSVSTLIRWTPLELDFINSQAVASTRGIVSEYVRGASLNRPLPVSHSYDVDRLELVRALGQLGKVGSNVNQLAKTANQGQPLQSGALESTLQAVEKCADEIRFILTNYKPPRQ